MVAKVDGFGFGFFLMLPFDTIIVIRLMCKGFNEERSVIFMESLESILGYN